MPARFHFNYDKGQFVDVMARKRDPIVRAAFAAIKEVGTTIKFEGRANIASAGFGSRWQNAFRVDIYDITRTKKPGELAAAWVYHKIPYSGIFERGGTISPKKGPLLWAPTKFAPLKAAGGYRMTPARFKQSVGAPLFPIRNKKGHTVLMANVAVGSGTKFSRGEKKPTLAQLRKGAKALKDGQRGVRLRALPMFTGLPRVVIKKRFAITQIIQRSRRLLAEAFVANLKDT